MDITQISVEKIDIFKEMEFYNAKMREVAVKNSTEEKIKAYDYGVKNTMEVLKMLFLNDGKPTSKLIYQNSNEPLNKMAHCVRLSEVLTELQECGQIGGG